MVTKVIMVMITGESEDDFESDTDRLPDVHVQQLLPLGGEEEGEAKRCALVSIIVMIVFEMSIIIIVMIVIERSIIIFVIAIERSIIIIVMIVIVMIVIERPRDNFLNIPEG